MEKVVFDATVMVAGGLKEELRLVSSSLVITAGGWLTEGGDLDEGRAYRVVSE